MRILDDFNIELDNEEILRLLQSNEMRKMSRKAPKSLLKDIKEMKKEANPLIKPKAVFSLFNSQELEPKFLFKKSETTVFAICTIGKKLEKLSKGYLKKGKLAKGVILDAIASHAAEQTAEHVNQTILRELKEQTKGKEITSRFSPGYCQWELEKGQKLIFKLLEGSEIGVTISTSLMMNPIKSVSFAINIGDEIDKELGVRGCETCDMINCAYRRD